MLIAIDGPAGAGKSSVARGVALELGFPYMDSGAMYRCVALLWLASPAQEPAALARAARIELGGAGILSAGQDARELGRVVLDGRDVTEEIRTAEVSEAASHVAADPGVRAALVAKQRELIAAGDWVAEGRDIGTVVAPEAGLKVFLTADPQERARRRAGELGADQATVLAEQALRDARDSTREHSPLRPAAGALTLDTTRLSVEEVVARIAALARDASGSR
ncbi:MAG: (d)CMP kinase [Gemmatimonadales bacterium]